MPEPPRRSATDLDQSDVSRRTLIIGRPAVEAGDLSPSQGLLSRLMVSTDSVRHFRGRVALEVDGYLDDPRRLGEIPEVRTYMQRLDAWFGYWFWFLEPTGDSLKLLATCCCELSDVSLRDGSPARAVEPEVLGPFIDQSTGGSMRTRIVRIGDSQGVRIPKTILDEAGLPDEVDLRAEGGCIVISPAEVPRAGWAEAAAAGTVLDRIREIFA